MKKKLSKKKTTVFNTVNVRKPWNAQEFEALCAQRAKEIREAGEKQDADLKAALMRIGIDPASKGAAVPVSTRQPVDRWLDALNLFVQPKIHPLFLPIVGLATSALILFLIVPLTVMDFFPANDVPPYVMRTVVMREVYMRPVPHVRKKGDPKWRLWDSEVVREQDERILFWSNGSMTWRNP